MKAVALAALVILAGAAASHAQTTGSIEPSNWGAPALNNPQNPVSYGADATGVNNSANAFQNAIKVGDLDVPAGTFRIDSAVQVPSNRNIRCEPGAALKYTTTGDIAMFQWNGTVGGSVFNCHFQGSYYNAQGKPGPASSAFQEFLFIQSIGGVGGGLTIANNDFNGIGGWIAAIQLYANDANQPGPQNNLITHNTFEHCGAYAVQITSGKNNTVSYNTLTDCNGFIEADDTGQENTGNVIDHNTLTYVYGVAQWNPGPAYLALTCGASPQGFNYGGNTCSNNTVIGFSARAIH